MKTQCILSFSNVSLSCCLLVAGDDSIKPDDVKNVIFVSGKHYYTLVNERQARNITNTAIIRLESLCPFPTSEINKELAKYKKAKSKDCCFLCNTL